MINTEITTTKGMEQAQKQMEQAKKSYGSGKRRKPTRKGEEGRMLTST